jgi:cell division protein FtsW
MPESPLVPPESQRSAERALLHLAAVIVGVSFGTVVARRLQNGLPVERLDWALPGIWVVLMYLVHALLQGFRCRGDEVLWPLMALLSGLGLVMKYRLGFVAWRHLAEPRLYAYPLSVAAFVLTWLTWRGRRLNGLQRFYPLCALLSLALMLIILFAGPRFRGALYGPGLTTPSELLKVLLTVYLAGFLTYRHTSFERTVGGLPLPPLRAVVPFLLVWLTPQVLFILQHDLGIIILFGLLVIILFYTATGRFGYIVAGAAFTALVGYGIYSLEPADLGPMATEAGGLLPTQELRRIHARIDAWRDPWSDPHGRGWHVLQSLFALRAGAFDGTGLGAGSSQHIPLLESDFIYAAFAEELGLLGSGLLLVLYGFLIWRGALIAVGAADRFRSLLAIGYASLLALQILLNVGGVIKLLPITGLTLPFLSHGGSSLLVCYTMMGFLLAISEPPSAEDPAG